MTSPLGKSELSFEENLLIRACWRLMDNNVLPNDAVIALVDWLVASTGQNEPDEYALDFAAVLLGGE